MKKSEKLKGKVAVANRKKQYTRYGVAAVAVIVVALIVGFYLFNPFVAKNGDTVTIYYTESFANGTELYTNLDGDPLVFTIGNKTVIQGLEEAVIGMAPNTTKTVNISFDKAYGPYREDLIHDREPVRSSKGYRAGCRTYLFHSPECRWSGRIRAITQFYQGQPDP